MLCQYRSSTAPSSGCQLTTYESNGPFETKMIWLLSYLRRMIPGRGISGPMEWIYLCRVDPRPPLYGASS